MGVWGCVCIPINQASCLLYWLDPLTLAVAGASWSPAFLQQTKDSASCSTRSITASPTPAAKAEGERRTQKLPSSSQMQLSKLPLRSPPFFGGVFALKCPCTAPSRHNHIACLVKQKGVWSKMALMKEFPLRS